ncbi:MAG: hypothetical protein HY457_02020 [Parcubacteria group bacterium]|nr:hypothetical protein [Parcubacteria group bacterium]
MITLFSIAHLMAPWIWVSVGGIILTAGDIMVKLAIEGKGEMIFWSGFSLFIVGEFFLAMAFFGQDIAQASLAMVLINIITLTLVNIFVFDEPMSLLGYGAMVLGLISYIVLEFYA